MALAVSVGSVATMLAAAPAVPAYAAAPVVSASGDTVTFSPRIDGRAVTVVCKFTIDNPALDEFGRVLSRARVHCITPASQPMNDIRLHQDLLANGNIVASDDDDVVGLNDASTLVGKLCNVLTTYQSDAHAEVDFPTGANPPSGTLGHRSSQLIDPACPGV